MARSSFSDRNVYIAVLMKLARSFFICFNDGIWMYIM